MAVVSKCPSCGRQLGGACRCQNPDCAQGLAGGSASARAKRGGRPELLDRIPTSFLASPAMFPIGMAVALLYGMFLFAVMPARKVETEPEFDPSAYASATPRPAPTTTPAPAPTPDTSKPTGNPSSPKPDGNAAAGKSGEKKPSPKGSSRGKSSDSAKKEMAKADKPAPVPAPAPKADPTKPVFWGVLAGLPGDCQFGVDGLGLTLTIPNSLHVLSAELNTKNAPKLLTEVKGDFVARVNVPGKMSPGVEPLPNLPFTFQGAGLLVWQDENNYLRLERISLFAKQGGRAHGVFVEICKDGKTVPTSPLKVRDTDLALRLERKGSEFRCQYSTDAGETWFDVKRQTVTFPALIGVGVSASSASQKPFPARFEEFDLTGPKS